MTSEEAIIRMMEIVSVDIFAVVVATIAAFVAGFLWYSPALFGKKWMKLMGVSEKDKSKMKDGMTSVMAKGFIVELIMAYVLAHILAFSNSTTIMDAIQGAFWVWLGFVATTLYMGVIYEKKSFEWWWISAGHYLVGLIVMGVVIVSM